MDLVVFLQSMPPQVLHLNIDVEELHTFANVLLHLHDEELVDFHELLQVLGVAAHSLGVLSLALELPLDRLLVLIVFFLYMMEELLEQLAVVHDQLVDDGTMHVHAWKLVRVAVDHLRHPCEVLRNRMRV